MLHPTKLRLSSTSFFLLISAVFVGALLVFMVNGSAAKGPEPNTTHETGESAPNRHVKVAGAYGKLPLSFEANAGQAHRRVRFIARGVGYGLFLTSNETVLALRSGTLGSDDSNPGTLSRESYKALSMKLVGARSRPAISGVDELPGKLNYFIGNDPRKWRKGVAAYSKVKYRDVYPGVDVVYHGSQGQLEYDFVIAPGRSPRRIKMAFKGMESITVDPDGTLVLRTAAGDIRQPKPIAYQDVDGVRQEVEVRYKVRGNDVSFEVGTYDSNHTLVIDPVLIYSTFLGGTSGEQGLGIAVDAQGSAYLTGSTISMDFPLAGAFQNTLNSFGDAFVVKLNPAGTALIYSTYLGGDSDEIGHAVAVDAQGSAYVVGTTFSGTFPVTPGAFQDTKDGSIDAFVTKLTPSGSSLSYSTYLGGDHSDVAYGIAVSADSRAYVVGRTESTRFRTLPFPTPRNGSPVYKSTNSAVQWFPSGSGLTSSVVNGFGFDPSTANTLYAATNLGVFKSADAAASWSLTGTASPSTAPQSANVVVIDPSNPNIIYAAAAFEGVYKSTDGGNTYTVKNNGFQVPFVNALAIDPTTPTTLFAGTAFGMYKTTNGGDSWVELENGFIPTTPRVNEVAINPTNSAIVYVGTSRGIFKTTNGGALWTPDNSGVLSFTQITALAIDPLNPSTLYASGFLGGIFKTTDGGATWSASNTGIPATAINALAIDPLTPMTLYAATTGSGIFKSTNGGANWTQSNTGLGNATVNSVGIVSSNPAILYAGTFIGGDAFAVKLDPSGSTLEYLLNFGGNENDEARGVGLGADGNAYIVGSTNSPNFPVLNAFQSAAGGLSDAFVAKLNSSGTGFIYSTYLGGNGSDQGRGIAVRSGSAHVVGQTTSSNFPLVNAIKLTLAQFDTDAFVTKLNPAGDGADFSTFLGGSNTDQGFGVAVDTDGSLYVTGGTRSSDFPTLDAPQPTFGGGNFDAFVTKLSAAGTSLIYSTYLGGTSTDQGNGIATDGLGNTYVVGVTSSDNFPIANPFQSTLKGTDAFVTKLGVEVDVSISKTDSRDPVMVNNPLRFTLTVMNGGPSPATGVTVTDTLPSAVTFVAATPTQGTCSINNLTVTCVLGTLAPATSAIVTIVVTPTSTGVVTNSASVIVNEPDRNPANNTSTQTTTVSASPSINGHVRDGGGNGVNGVLMTLSDSQSSTQQTDANGFYQFAELPSGGNYTITPSKAAFSFDPSAQTFNNLSADQTANFVASPCTYTLAPTSQSFSAGGGSGSVAVTSLNGCPWTASSSADWITVTSGASGVGNGTASFTVSPTNVARAGRLTIAGQSFAIYQEFNSCSTPAFSVATYNVSTGPRLVRATDLNGDGRLDIAGAPTFGSEASLLLNDGAGSFTTSSFSLGLEPQGFVLADLNGDGKPDVAVTAYNFPFVRIFFNNGSGGFGQSSVDIPFSSQGQSPLTRNMFTSDLNSDGKADLLVSTPGASAIQVLLGNGSGGFTQQPPITSGSFDVLIGVTDVNANGAPDLIFGGGGDNNRPLSVRLGDGAGNAGAPIVSSGVTVTLYVATADFDGDGKLDIAASTVIPGPDSTPSNPTFTNGISILKGDGAGHFTTQSSFDSGSGSLPNVTVSDFNNDAKPDIAFVKGERRVTVLLGDGAGGLGATIEVDAGASDTTAIFGIATADFDLDSRADIAVGGRDTSVLRNNCAAAPSITGRVTGTHTAGLAGVTISLSGPQATTVTTDASGNYFIGNLTPGASYVVTPSKDNVRFAPASRTIDNVSGVHVADFVGTPITVQFTQIHYLVEEFTPSVQINVSRSGDLSGETTVDYATINGTASDRSDYTAARGTLRFGPGEALKSFNVLFTDDALVEGFESLTLALSNANGAILSPPGSFLPSSVLTEIRDNDFNPDAPNPIEDSRFFVRQHYHDFLNREPDAAGMDFWANQIDQCSPAPCRDVKRINVSAAFFLSIEFQQTGYLVYRVYKAAYGDMSSPGNPNLVPIIRLPEFLPDTQRIGLGVQVGIGDWEQQLESNKTSYMLEFVQRPRFLNEFPISMPPAEFVDKLNLNAGGVLSQAERDQLIAELTGAMDANQGRASVLRKVAEDADMNRNETNRAFVQMQYFGYLRRNPDDLPDSDFAGWQFWLNKLDQFNGNFVEAEMVKAFITSGEYTHRFGR